MIPYYLSICAIVKDEAPYIKEWLEFHILQGVEHFFIYDNESTDGTYKILQSYSDLGLVTLNKVFGLSKQLPTYQSCLTQYGNSSQWIAFIDVDEFLFTKEYNLSILLKDYEKYSALAVNWILYGSSGKEFFEEGFVIERFTNRAKQTNKHVKSIVQPHMTIGVGKNSHYFKLKTPAVNELNQKLPDLYHFSKNPMSQIFRINHYHTKSKEEYFERRSRPAVSTGKIPTNVEEKFIHHDQNDIDDPILVKFVPLIKEALAKR